jgi:hypothetical protein
LPNGVKDLGGGLLSNENYGVSRYAKNGNDMLWLEKILNRDAKGVPTWQVKDVLMLGKLKKSRAFVFLQLDLYYKRTGKPRFNRACGTCGKQKIYKILKAWNASVKTKSSKKFRPSGIKCEVGEI